MNSHQDIHLSIYFPPTGVPVNGGGNIPCQFYSSDVAYDLCNEIIDDNTELKIRYKLGVDGVSGIFGFIFGTGIDEDCQQVVTLVEKILGNIRSKKTGQRIIINCAGYSRGGVSALLLAKKLGKFPLDMIEVNLALIDPVPGNSIISSKLDLFDLTMANQVSDLSDCHNLKRVCSVYHTIPSPDYFFSPVRPMYPQHTCVEENFVPDVHFEIGKGYSSISGQVVVYFKKFMEMCGTVFSEIFNNCTPKKNTTCATLAKRKVFSKEDETITRSCHSLSSAKEEIRFIRPNDTETLFKNSEFISDTDHLQMPAAKTVYDNLLSLAGLVSLGMSADSKSSEKYGVINDFIEMLNEFSNNLNEYNNDEIKYFVTEFLRILTQIALQRDRNILSLFTTTKSGDFLKTMLKSDEFFWFRYLVSGTTEHKESICYKDLRSFAGGMSPQDFNAWYAEDRYAKMKNLIGEFKQINTNRTAVTII